MAAENVQTKTLEEVQAEQRRRWLGGDRAPLETYLAQYPELASREQDVLQLIAAEVRMRESLGERPSRAEYADRFPAYAAQLDEHVSFQKAPPGASLQPGGSLGEQESSAIAATRSFTGGSTRPKNSAQPAAAAAARDLADGMMIGRYEVSKLLGEE
jgi:hypothetical protein